MGGGAAVSIYQVRLDAWRRVPEEGDRPLTCREAAGWLAGHLRETGFTHVDLLPSPAAGGADFLAPCGGREGAGDLAALLDAVHGAGAGVILTRAVAPGELHRLERPESRAPLLAAAAAGLDAGIDGFRLELPLGADGDLAPAAAHFVGLLGGEIAARRPGALLVLGGSDGAPRALPPGAPTRTLLWRGDWEARTREYFALDPLHRSHRHDLVVRGIDETRGAPALLPLSCGGGPRDGSTLLAGLGGGEPGRFAHLRLLLGYAWCAPGAKLLGMGDEFGQREPRRADGSLDWHLLGAEAHRRVQRWVAHLNILLRGEPALAGDAGFAWVVADDRAQSVVGFERAAPGAAPLLVVCNFTPVARQNYRVGVPCGGFWAEALNSDAREYGGRGMGNLGGVEATPVPFHGRRHSLSLLLPPLAALVFRGAAA